MARTIRPSACPPLLLLSALLRIGLFPYHTDPLLHRTPLPSPTHIFLLEITPLFQPPLRFLFSFAVILLPPQFLSPSTIPSPGADWPCLHLGNARRAGRVEVKKTVIFTLKKVISEFL